MVDENVEWIKKRKEFLKNIGSFKPEKNRIKTVTQLNYMDNAIAESALGWINWINGWLSIELTKKINIKNPDVVVLSDKELSSFHNEFREFALKFIEMDLKYTTLIQNKIQKKKVKEPEDENLKRMIV